jgi:hypothetical protein
MSATYIDILAQAILYSLLAVTAVTAAKAEKHAGHDHSHLHLRRASILYALLAASQLLHI